MADHNILGNEGERAATEFLIAKGWIIRETNWRLGHLEVDIIAEEPERNMLHIVEVKTRTDIVHYDPMSAVTAAKQRRLIAAGNAYVRYNGLRSNVCYDVVIVVPTGPTFDVHFIGNAFRPQLKTYK